MAICVALGFAFAVYGVALIAYGSLRAREVDEAVAHGEFRSADACASIGLTVTGAVLGLATAVLIVAN